MKRCVLINWIALRYGATFSIRMAKIIAETQKADVYAIVSKHANDINYWRNLNGVKLIEVEGYTNKWNFFPRMLSFYLFETKKIRKIIRGYDEVITYVPGLSYWSFLVQKAIGRSKLIYTMHDPKVHNESNYFIKFANDWFGRKSDKVIILSNCFADYVVETYNKKKEDVCVMPLGFEGRDSRSESLTGAPKFETGKNIHLLFFGRIEEYKGLDVLADAFEKIQKVLPNVSLTIAGNGDFSAYKDKYKRLSNVEILNKWIGDDEIYPLFSKTNTISILPYKSGTQSGVITLAQKYGTPIVASRCGGIAEQIEDGVSGYLVEPGNPDGIYDKVVYISEHIDEVNKVIANAYNEITVNVEKEIKSKLCKCVFE